MNINSSKKYTRRYKRLLELEKLKSKISDKVIIIRRSVRLGALPKDFRIFDPVNIIKDAQSFKPYHIAANPSRGLKRFARMREPTTNSMSTIGKRLIKCCGRKKPSTSELIGTIYAQERDEFTRRWEEMICQTTWNIIKLLDLTNSRVKVFFSKCYYDYKRGNYYAGSDQCMDIQVIKHTPDDERDTVVEYISLDEKILDFLPDPRGASCRVTLAPNYKNQKKSYYFQEKTYIGSKYTRSSIILDRHTAAVLHPILSDKEDYSVMLNSHIIKSKLMRSIRAQCRGVSSSEGPVYIFKTIIPGPHFALSLYYPLEKRVEFFDPGGSWGGEIAYRDADGNIPYSTTLEKLRNGRRGVIPPLNKNNIRTFKYKPCSFTEFKGYDGGGDPVEDALCLAFQNLFGHYDGIEFVAVNLVNLQPLEEDAHCQVWVWLYVYIKFVLKLSTRDTLRYFSLLEEKELLILIEHWREFLLYFDFEGAKMPPFI